METLEELRERIDSLDKTLREAFLARMQAAAAVAGYKAQHGLPVLDAAREEAVVEKNLAALAGDEKAMAPYYEDFVRHNMALSRALQQALLGRGAVAYQGVEGACAAQAGPPRAGRGLCGVGRRVSRGGKRRGRIWRAAV